MFVKVPTEAKRGHQSSWSWSNCQLWAARHAGNWIPISLEEQEALLPTEPSLTPLCNCFCWVTPNWYLLVSGIIGALMLAHTRGSSRGSLDLGEPLSRRSGPPGFVFSVTQPLSAAGLLATNSAHVGI